MRTHYSLLRTLMVIWLAAACRAPFCAAQEGTVAWTHPRGDSYATSSSAVPGPAAPTVRWVHELRPAVTAPLVADATGAVYLGGVDREGGTVHALDLRDGHERWAQRVEGGVTGLAIGDGVVLAATSIGVLRALSCATGEVVAEMSGLGQVREGWFSGLLIVPGGPVLVSQYAALHALAGDLSMVRWNWPRGHTGEPPIGLSVPAITRSGDALVASDSLRALSMADGQVRWEYGVDVPCIPTSPAVNWQGRVLWGKTDIIGPGLGRGVLTCLDGSSGNLLWSQELTGYPTLTLAVSAGRAVLVTLDETLSCWSVADGSNLWSVRLPHVLAFPGFETTPVIDADGRIYVGDGPMLLCYALADGAELFRWEVPSGIHRIILPGDGSLVGVGLGAVYCFADEGPPQE